MVVFQPPTVCAFVYDVIHHLILEVSINTNGIILQLLTAQCNVININARRQTGLLGLPSMAV